MEFLLNAPSLAKGVYEPALAIEKYRRFLGVL
jgi:hypothetical protein